MAWSQGMDGTLGLVTFFLIVELLQRRRELGYERLDLPQGPRL
jgi:hypothetical protein